MILVDMRRYTVGVAGQTVNLLPKGSGGSTPSRRTKFGEMGKSDESQRQRREHLLSSNNRNVGIIRNKALYRLLNRSKHRRLKSYSPHQFSM